MAVMTWHAHSVEAYVVDGPDVMLTALKKSGGDDQAIKLEFDKAGVKVRCNGQIMSELICALVYGSFVLMTFSLAHRSCPQM